MTALVLDPIQFQALQYLHTNGALVISSVSSAHATVLMQKSCLLEYLPIHDLYVSLERLWKIIFFVKLLHKL